MTKTGFVIANLFRRKIRTTLTLGSIVMAFVLFGLLQAVNQLFSSGADFVGNTRLIAQSRVSFTQSLPIRLLPEIEAIPGVKRVNWQQWFGGVIKAKNQPIVAFATDPQRLHETYPEWVMPEQQWKDFASTRTGMIAGKLIAENNGWKVGSKIPLDSNIFPQKDGSKSWTFDLVGIIDGKDEEWQKRAGLVFINYAYFDEANQFGQGRAGNFVMVLDDPDRATEVAGVIDAKFENTPDETKTQSEKAFNEGFAKQFGDFGQMVRWILFAVFFALLMVVGNTMAQSVRERIPELAVLKTLGFSDQTVLGFVLGESLALCCIGGLIGMLLATGLGVVLAKLTAGQLPVAVDKQVWLFGAVATILMGFAVGILPAIRALRLKIVDALAGR